jgi:hypothetical protein
MTTENVINRLENECGTIIKNDMRLRMMENFLDLMDNDEAFELYINKYWKAKVNDTPRQWHGNP